MKRHYLDHDPTTGTKQNIYLDGTGKAVVESIQDCEPILELNKAEAGQLDRKKDYWKIGTIPLITCFEWAKESGTRPFSAGWMEYAKKQLNLPDYAYLNPNRIKL